MAAESVTRIVLSENLDPDYFDFDLPTHIVGVTSVSLVGYTIKWGPGNGHPYYVLVVDNMEVILSNDNVINRSFAILPRDEVPSQATLPVTYHPTTPFRLSRLRIKIVDFYGRFVDLSSTRTTLQFDVRHTGQHRPCPPAPEFLFHPKLCPADESSNEPRPAGCDELALLIEEGNLLL